MIIVFPDGVAIQRDFGWRLCGLRHNFSRPICIIISQLEMDHYTIPRGAPKDYTKQTYIDTVILPCLAPEGKLILGRWNKI